jgi:hypothetical protein
MELSLEDLREENLDSKNVFIIGNGSSRREFDLHQLVGRGIIVGCNESYKFFPHFDMVASIDGPSTLDIKANYNKLHIYKWKENWFRSDTGEDLGRLVGSYNAGQLALKAAVELLQPDTIYLLGVDFGGSRLYTGRVTDGPTNKCWDTWKKLAKGQDVIHITNGDSIYDETITYETFTNSLPFW